MEESNKNSTIFTVLFFILIGLSIFFTYYRIFIKEDFLVTNEITCDSSYERNCFYSEEYICEDELDESTCGIDTWYFKKITKKAYNIPECLGDDCEEVFCQEGEADCEYTYCTSEDEYEEDGYKVSCVE